MIPFVSTAVLLVLFLALQPTSKAPIKDEGGFYRMSVDLPAYGLGVYEAFDMTSTSLTVLSGGYLSMAVFGKSLPVARGFVLVFCLLCLLGSYPALRRAGAERAAILAFLLAVAVNPLFARYANIFTTDGVFVSLCLLSLACYAVGIQEARRGMLLAGSLFAALAIYTRQPGIVLPAVPMAFLLLQAARRRQLPDWTTGLILILPYLAFLPLALFFYQHSGSFLMYVSKPWEHSFHGFSASVLLWAVNFLGFFTAPFLIPLLRGHGHLLAGHRRLPLLLCAALTPLILLGESSIADPVGGLGRIFSAVHLPAVLVTAAVLICQFAGWITLAILGLRSVAGTAPDRWFFLFSVLYMAGISTKGGVLLVHYAAPLVLPAAWAVAAAYVRCGAGGRTLFVAGIALFALFTTVWSKAESVLGNRIHEALVTIEETRRDTDLLYTWSSTALQFVPRAHITFDPQAADFVLMTPEDPHVPELPEGLQEIRTVPVVFFGKPLGDVRVLQRLPPASPESRPED